MAALRMLPAHVESLKVSLNRSPSGCGLKSMLHWHLYLPMADSSR